MLKVNSEETDPAWRAQISQESLSFITKVFLKLDEACSEQFCKYLSPAYHIYTYSLGKCFYPK